MSEEPISPAAMMDLLHSPYPENVRANLHWASLEMLHHLYREQQHNPQVKTIESILRHAIDEWNDEQVEDFCINYLFESPQSDEFREKSPQERRAALRLIYDYLFERT
jgi:hypothetical protein